MTDMISSELEPSIFTHGFFSRLNTCGRPFTHSWAWMHLAGSQKTTISPFEYSLIGQAKVSFLLEFSAILKAVSPNLGHRSLMIVILLLAQFSKGIDR